MSGIVVDGGGWWPPGKGEGSNWTYEEAPLHLNFDGRNLDVCLPDERGIAKRALVSLPVAAIARALAEGEA